MRLVLVPLLFSLTVTLQTGAPVEHAHLRLDYARAEGAERCPSAHTLEQWVTAYLGYSPWHPDARETLHARVSVVDHALVARVERRGPDGSPKGRRVLRSDNRDCEELTAAMALAIAISVDPNVVTRPAPPPSAFPPHNPVPPRRKTSSSSLRYFGELRYRLAWGSASEPSPGAVLAAGLQYNRWSLATEAALDAPVALESSGRRAWLGFTTTSLVPCHHVAWMAACGLATLGVARWGSDPPVTFSPSTVGYAALGARWTVELPLSSALHLVGGVDGQAVLTRIHLRHRPSGEPLWDAPAASLVAHGGARMLLP